MAVAKVLRSKSIKYMAVWAQWSLATYRKLDHLFTNILKTATYNMGGGTVLALYMSWETLERGFLRFSDEAQFRNRNYLRACSVLSLDVLDNAFMTMQQHWCMYIQ